MTRLLDVNVLIALAWPSHEHHQAANAWFRTVGQHSWATCPLTQLAFVRISANPAFIDGAVSPIEACGLLEIAVKVGNHQFWPDDLSLTAYDVVGDAVQGHQQTTDAYLLALAKSNRGKLSTFDKRITSMASVAEDSADTVELIE